MIGARVAMSLAHKRSAGVVGVCALALGIAGCSSDPAAVSDGAEREQRFREMMTGVTLVGKSTRFGREGLSDGEQYAIDRVTKLPGNTWLFQIRMRVHGREIPVPIPIPIEWAGDTPVISMTDVSIPGMGTYTARVVLFRDHYAGTWSGQGGGGGHVFGDIVRNGTE